MLLVTIVEMDFKDEPTVTSSSNDVTGSGVSGMDISQPLIQPGSVSPGECSVVQQPQATLPSPVEPTATQLDGPFTAEPASMLPCSTEPTQPCPPRDQLSSPGSEHVLQPGEAITGEAMAISAGAQVSDTGEPAAAADSLSTLSQQVEQNLVTSSDLTSTMHQPQQPGEAITGEAMAINAGAQVSDTAEPAAAADSLSTLSQQVEQNLVTAEPSSDLRSTTHQPQQPGEAITGEAISGDVQVNECEPSAAAADEAWVSALSRQVEQNLVIVEPTADLTSTVHEPQQPTDAQQQIPACVTSETRANAQMTPDTAVEQQNVEQVSTVGLQQPPEVVTLPDQPALVTVEPLKTPETLAPAQQPVDGSATVPESEAAALASVTECQPPGVSAEQQLTPNTADQHQQSASSISDGVTVLEPGADVLPTESIPPSTAQSPSPPDEARQQPHPPTIGEVSVSSTKPSDDDEVQPRAAATEQPSDQAPRSPPPSDVISSHEDGRRRPEVMEHVEQPTTGDLDVVMATTTTPNDVIVDDVTRDAVSAGSDTDDAPELIGDDDSPTSRDRDAANQMHDHQHPPAVGRP